MKTIVHINRHILARNRECGATPQPPVSVKTYLGTRYGYEVEFTGPAQLVYRPDKPLGCGATVWIETTSPVNVR